MCGKYFISSPLWRSLIPNCHFPNWRAFYSAILVLIYFPRGSVTLFLFVEAPNATMPYGQMSAGLRVAPHLLETDCLRPANAFADSPSTETGEEGVEDGLGRIGGRRISPFAASV